MELNTFLVIFNLSYQKILRKYSFCLLNDPKHKANLLFQMLWFVLGIVIES